ncbi:hypothetical protein N7532_011089 [Penicillium argentinense]|uniref:CSN8/PSMD8/EIF3K domain-containing protein n=1 Tax=Penicillium argentinense TaxID=1131581 RepID=A0A9W9EHX7_9EURO|nr:uncharacterized protein N7532_011089 [Penicillium argentinense]KAJ5082046.1 hypothetical protein N7532_011089 [Penicillium argentinense]
MELPPFSREQISKLIASNAPPSQLHEILSQYEPDACLMSAGSGSPETGAGDPELLCLFYSSFFFAHLLTKKIPEARALTQRFPETLKHHDPSLQSCLTLLRAIWQTEHAQVYRVLRGQQWSETLQPLIKRYESFFQDQALIAVSNSYEAIRPAVAANFLGLDTQAAEQGDPTIIQKLTACGWTWNPESQLLYPSRITVPPTDQQPTNDIRGALAIFSTPSV